MVIMTFCGRLLMLRTIAAATWDVLIGLRGWRRGLPRGSQREIFTRGLFASLDGFGGCGAEAGFGIGGLATGTLGGNLFHLAAEGGLVHD